MERLGHDVLTVASVLDALNVYMATSDHEKNTPFDLLISDIGLLSTHMLAPLLHACAYFRMSTQIH